MNKYTVTTTETNKTIYPKNKNTNEQFAIKIRKITHIFTHNKSNDTVYFIDTQFGRRQTYKIKYCQVYKPNILNQETKVTDITESVTKSQFDSKLSKFTSLSTNN